MVAASVWSLLIPSMQMVEERLSILSFIPAVVGFMIGIFFILILDILIPHQHIDSDIPEGIASNSFRKTTILVLAVVIHNIPEAMAFGVALAGAKYGNLHLQLPCALE